MAGRGICERHMLRACPNTPSLPAYGTESIMMPQKPTSSSERPRQTDKQTSTLPALQLVICTYAMSFGGSQIRQVLPTSQQIRPISCDATPRWQCARATTTSNQRRGNRDETGPGEADISSVLSFFLPPPVSQMQSVLDVYVLS